MKKGLALKIFTALLWAVAALPSMTSANPFIRDVRIIDMAVTDHPDDLMLSLKVEGAFKEKLEEAVMSGAPTTFSFFIIVSEFRGIILDRKILEVTLSHTIKYNNLKNDYTVKRSWENDKPLTTESFDQAKQWMTEISDLRLMPLSHLQKGGHYKIKAKAELEKVTLPLFLNYIFFFVTLLDFETDWQTIKFIY
ncbi:MAG: DUF4390 domain-containing protein [Desulfobacterales bacterium]|nr:DUF4390 domain-containing protein [Desulfobacterales bacterium]